MKIGNFTWALETKQNAPRIINHMVKTIYWIQHTKRIETEKNNDRDGKALYKLTNNAMHGKYNEIEK